MTIAQKNNRAILKSQQSVVINEATYEQTKGNFLPYFGVNLTDVVTNNPLNVFGFKLLQEDVEQADFNPALLNAPDVTNNFQLSINAMMPLYNPEAKAEQIAVQHQISMAQSMAQRTSEGIELEVIKSYYLLLLSQNAIDVLTETNNAARANYDILNNFYDQGLVLKSDLLDMQIMVNQSEMALQSATYQLANAQSQFNYILGGAEEVQYRPMDAMSDLSKVAENPTAFNVNRADFKAMEYGIQAMESMVKATDKSFLPKIKAFAGFDINDDIPFGVGANNFQVGVTVGWDIYKGNMRNSTINKTNAEIKQKRMELEDSIASAQLELIKTRREIADTKSQITLDELSIKQAEEALKIRKNRFKQGLEKSTDIINAETQLSQRKLARLQSLYKLHVQNAYLDFLLK